MIKPLPDIVESAQSAPATSPESARNTKATLFAAPKPFFGHTGLIQRNAIESWCRLRPEIDLFLFGDEDGIREVAEEYSIRHFPNVTFNESGTPQLDSIFEQAIDAAETDLLMYTNADIVYNDSLPIAIGKLQQLELDAFLAIGQRTDFDQEEPFDFCDPQWDQNLSDRLSHQGQLASILCKDYFIFPGKNYRGIPSFSIGRGNWDNWMVSQAAKSNAPVIDVTSVLLAGHQNHDYGHAGGRMKAYVTGEEARQNKELAGGTNYVRGSVATHRLLPTGEIKRANRFPLWTFVKDFPRVARLLYQFFRH